MANILFKVRDEKLAVIEEVDRLLEKKVVLLERLAEIDSKVELIGDVSAVRVELEEVQEYIYKLGLEERPVVEVEAEVVEENAEPVEENFRNEEDAQ